MCVFCEILTGNAPAQWVNKPSDDGVAISCFHNRLKWAETMLLIVPNEHLTQKKYWKSNLIFDAIQLAIKLGDKFCRHSGFRIISNFGKAAHQSQNHGHLHMISGTPQQKGTSQEKYLDWIGEIGYKTIFQNNDNEILFMKIGNFESNREMWSSMKIKGLLDHAVLAGEKNFEKGFRIETYFEYDVTSPSLYLTGGSKIPLYM